MLKFCYCQGAIVDSPGDRRKGKLSGRFIINVMSDYFCNFAVYEKV